MARKPSKSIKTNQYGVTVYTRVPLDIYQVLSGEAQRQTISIAAVVAQMIIKNVSSQRAAAESDIGKAA